MKTEGDAQRLRIYVGESDRWDGRPLYEALIRAAREKGLAGATALRGIEGFGTNGRIHTVKVLRLSEDLPIVVEIIDRADRIAAFMSTVDEMVSEGTVTLEKVHTVMFRRDAVAEPPIEADEIPLDTAQYAAPAETQNIPFVWSNERAQKVMEVAKTSAAKSRRVFADSIDVLLAMLCDSSDIATKALEKLGIDCKTIERSLREVVSRDDQSAVFLRTLETKSLGAAKWLGHDDIGAEHLLLALCEIRPNAATDVLMRLGTQPRDVCEHVLQSLGHEDDWQRWLADHPDM